MGDIASAFEEHLRSLSDTEWNALVQRVRPSASEPNPRLDNEVEGSTRIGTGRNEGLADAKRRGYID